MLFKGLLLTLECIQLFIMACGVYLHIISQHRLCDRADMWLSKILRFYADYGPTSKRQVWEIKKPVEGTAHKKAA
jgi:putative lipase involved disintegration of autophagic bodies